MTPKEKAKELVEKYEKYLFNRFTTDEDWVKCIECALIAVDEIKKLQNPYSYNYLTENKTDLIIQLANSYWLEVKQEIEKL